MLKFSLVDNALDSLEHAIKHITDEETLNTGGYKIVIRDLSHVVELLMKERLQKVHPAFVYDNVDKYESNDKKTIGPEKALERLKNIAKINFSNEDLSVIDLIRKTRNKIEHYEFTLNENKVKILIGSILVFIFKFSLDELDLDWASRRIEDPSWIKLNDYASFFEAQRKYLLEYLEGELYPAIACPMCRNELFDPESNICLLCGYREDILVCKWCESHYFESEANYPDAGLCPECERKDAFATANFEKYQLR